MTLYVSVAHNDGLMRYFLDYYQRKGVTLFVVATYCEHPDFTESLKGVNHVLVPAVGLDSSEALGPLIPQYTKPGEWYSVVDFDEFYHRDGFSSFTDWQGDWDWVGGAFLDRLAPDGSLALIDQTKTLDDQFPLAANVTDAISHGCCHKVVLARAGIELSRGHHFALSGRPAPFECDVHHFKWHGPKLLDWIKLRLNGPWASEHIPIIEQFEKVGHFDLSDPKLNVRPAPKIGV